MRRSLCWLVVCALTLSWIARGSISTAAIVEKAVANVKVGIAKDKPAGKEASTKKEDEKGKKESAAKASKPGEDKTEACKKAKVKEEPAKAAAGPKQPTATVKKEPFKIEVCLGGTFEALEMAPVVLRPKSWSGFTVLKAVEHGAHVKQGDLLVSLEMDKIDEAIADLRKDCQVADLTIRQSEEEIQALESLGPLDLVAARRGKRNADEDLDFFLSVSMPLSKKEADLSVFLSQEWLAFAQEELRQLEKMYKADDLTEETEEIVLRRSRAQLKGYEMWAEAAKVYRDRTLKTALPREEERVTEASKRQTSLARTAEVMIPLTLKKRRVELERAKLQRSQNEDRLNKLLADRTAMTIQSPADGIVYYGECEYGRFSGVSSAASQLQRGGRLAGDNVFMTIVKRRPMRVAAALPERNLEAVRGGLKATVKPTGYPDLKLSAIVSDVVRVPTGEGGFQARLTPSLDEKDEPLMPGMTCSVKLVVYQKADALALPADAVKREPLDEDARFVYLVDKDGKSKKTPVTVGKENDEKIEIVKGLKAGDKVHLKAPEDKE